MGAGNTRSCPAGTVLFRQGDAGRDMYVIVSGRVRISRHVADTDRLVAVLPAGEFFGEMSILNHLPRSATATAVEDTELIVVGPEAFDRLISRQRDVAVRLIRRLARRLEQANQEITLLLHRDPVARVAHALKRFGEARGRRAGGRLRIDLAPGELADRLGLDLAELGEVLRRFVETGILAGFDEAGLDLAEPRRLERFLEFLELKQQFAEVA